MSGWCSIHSSEAMARWTAMSPGGSIECLAASSSHTAGGSSKDALGSRAWDFDLIDHLGSRTRWVAWGVVGWVAWEVLTPAGQGEVEEREETPLPASLAATRHVSLRGSCRVWPGTAVPASRASHLGLPMGSSSASLP